MSEPERFAAEVEAAIAAREEASDDDRDDEADDRGGSGAVELSELELADLAMDASGGASGGGASVGESVIERYRVAGMVGQVNGRAVYAHDVLEPVHETLAALGRRVEASELTRREFRQRAGELIAGRVREMVNDALLLSEAERDLTEQERQYVRYFMQQRREELVRRHGRGSTAVADRTLREQTGKGLDQTLEDIRQREIVRRYMRLRLQPRINVTRRDIERYYRDHYDEYNPPATRTLRLVRAVDAEAAATIESRLEEGDSFESVASDEALNTFQPNNGGLMADAPGDDVFGFDELNEALAELDEGEHAGPIDAGGAQWFLKVEQIKGGEGQSLKEVQREIEQTLRLQQFRRLSAQHERELYERGSYDSMQQMSEALLEIAMNLYVGEAD